MTSKKPHIKMDTDALYVCVDGYWRGEPCSVRELSKKWDALVRVLTRKAANEKKVCEMILAEQEDADLSDGILRANHSG